MIFEDKRYDKLGYFFGFLAAYLLSTGMLFAIIYLRKLPLSIFHVGAITLTITLIGIMIKRLLR
jgi:hypothetical protein